VTIKTAYDTDALYVLLDWTDDCAGSNSRSPTDLGHWFDDGEGL
jgi:hypothetical protein